MSTSTRKDWEKTAPALGSLTPGPGHYNVDRGEKATRAHHGNVLFTSRNLTQFAAASPGPGAYEEVQPLKSGERGKFLSGKRPDLFEHSHNPGPGEYRIKGIGDRGKEGFTFSQGRGYVPPGISHLEGNRQPMIAFGHMCDFRHHVWYGACLNLECSKRGGWEKTNEFLIRKDGKEYEAAIEERGKALLETKSPLHFAAARQDLAVVNELCLNGADVNALDENGQTPLHTACGKLQILILASTIVIG